MVNGRDAPCGPVPGAGAGAGDDDADAEVAGEAAGETAAKG